MTGRASVLGVGSCDGCLCPVGEVKLGVKEHGSHFLHQSAVEALCHSILLRRVGCCGAVSDARVLEVGGELFVDILSASVCAYCLQALSV